MIPGYVPSIGETDLNKVIRGVRNLYENSVSYAAVVNLQVFTASGTYTPHANLLYAVIECVGGGGSGGGTTGAVGYFTAGAGGGAGAYSRKIVTAATVGASQAVTVGTFGIGSAADGLAGGDTSVGSLCLAKGGQGGKGGTTITIAAGGAGGSAASGTGDLKISGGDGSDAPFSSAVASASYNLTSPPGASSQYGHGGAGKLSSSGSAANGGAGSGYGSGGAGANCLNGAFSGNGGNGAAGIVIITEYCSQ